MLTYAEMSGPMIREYLPKTSLLLYDKARRRCKACSTLSMQWTCSYFYYVRIDKSIKARLTSRHAHILPLRFSKKGALPPLNQPLLHLCCTSVAPLNSSELQAPQ